MGTFLGLVFIAVAAVAGVYVGTRPTVMDGRVIAGKLTKAAKDGVTIECDRQIRIGVSGAAFTCVQARAGAEAEQVWYRMTRDGKLERTRAARLGRGGAARAEPATSAPLAGEAGDAD